MSIQDAYDQWSETYDTDKNFTRSLDQEVIRKMLSPLHCKSILEIGCGTGKNTEFLAQITQKVLAIDFSEGMIKKAREKIRQEHVSFCTSDITRRWPCEEKFADLVVCDLVMEHVQNMDFIFSETFRSLAKGGHFFICELHPCRQYQGGKAHFERDGKIVDILTFVHHISDFLNAAEHNGLVLKSLKEWWHEQDQGKPPRLISFLFEK